MGSSKSFGNDQLDSWSLKIIANHIHLPLHHIINLSISSGVFANKWKLAKVVPLFKGGKLSRNTPASYRPISLLPIVAKLVEKVVQTQLLQFMEKSGQMSTNCHAYRFHHSTTTAMIHMSDLIYTATDKNLITVLTTIDESSAFDCVLHKNLISKLRLYNCDDLVCTWMESYLAYRTQYVNVGAHQSRMMPVEMGVPQGSVLGPLLYSIYTNDIAETVKKDDCTDPTHLNDDLLFSPNCPRCGTIPFYADDATIITSSNSRVENQISIDRNLQTVKRYLNDNNLSVNESKTNLLEIMVKQKRTTNCWKSPVHRHGRTRRTEQTNCGGKTRTNSRREYSRQPVLAITRCDR